MADIKTRDAVKGTIKCGFVNDVLQNQKTSPRLIKALM